VLIFADTIPEQSLGDWVTINSRIFFQNHKYQQQTTRLGGNDVA